MTKKLKTAKFIFNPGAGREGESPRQLLEILDEMSKQRIAPEVYIMKEREDPKEILQKARRDGTDLIVVSGGDGTVEHVAQAMAGHQFVLGIIPTGTRNNLALNLGIPNEIPKAVTLLKEGRVRKIDVGIARTHNSSQVFLEVVTLGLLSDLYFVTDEIQHGDMSKIGEFIAKLAASTPFEVSIQMDNRRAVKEMAFMVVIANMQYLGANIQIDPGVSHRDGKLDVFVFTELSKINLVSYAIRSMAGNAQDKSVQHYRAKKVSIETSPNVSCIADGNELTEGKLSVRIKPRALRVIGGR